MKKKILVAVDGSVYSSNVLNYIGQLFPNLDDIHFHLLSIVPCSTSPAGREWLDEAELLNTLSPQARNKLNAQKHYMKKAVKQLSQYGIDEKQVTTDVRLSRMAITKDILHAARKGLYDALLIGRRGIGKLEEIFMGSVSATIVSECHDLPIWIIDGKVNSRKFLVPVDGSFQCLKAIDHLAHILKDNPYAEITLFNSAAMLANKTTCKPEDFYEQWGKEWCEEHIGRPDCVYHAPKQLLIENGFAEDRIQWLQTFKGIYPSRQILRQSLIDDFGTIVMGRRGGDIRKGIFKGVSDRVLFMAEEVAVWIIG